MSPSGHPLHWVFWKGSPVGSPFQVVPIMYSQKGVPKEEPSWAYPEWVSSRSPLKQVSCRGPLHVFQSKRSPTGGPLEGVPSRITLYRVPSTVSLQGCPSYVFQEARPLRRIPCWWSPTRGALQVVPCIESPTGGPIQGFPSSGSVRGGHLQGLPLRSKIKYFRSIGPIPRVPFQGAPSGDPFIGSPP